MTSVVAPQSTAATTPSASPSHCCAPTTGALNPSAKAEATPEIDKSYIPPVLSTDAWKVLADEILQVWLATEFEGGRHVRRIDEITEIEEAG